MRVGGGHLEVRIEGGVGRHGVGGRLPRAVCVALGARSGAPSVLGAILGRRCVRRERIEVVRRGAFARLDTGGAGAVGAGVDHDAGAVGGGLGGGHVELDVLAGFRGRGVVEIRADRAAALRRVDEALRPCRRGLWWRREVVGDSRPVARVDVSLGAGGAAAEEVGLRRWGDGDGDDPGLSARTVGGKVWRSKKAWALAGVNARVPSGRMINLSPGPMYWLGNAQPTLPSRKACWYCAIESKVEMGPVTTASRVCWPDTLGRMLPGEASRKNGPVAPPRRWLKDRRSTVLGSASAGAAMSRSMLRCLPLMRRVLKVRAGAAMCGA